MQLPVDDVRARLARLFQAPDGSFAFATSGTGTSGMEAMVANLVTEGTRVLVVSTGYFGDRLAEICKRYGGTISQVTGEWGRAIDPAAVRTALKNAGTKGIDVVACVHAETSTGVLNPVKDIAAAAKEHGALMLVDANLPPGMGIIGRDDLDARIGADGALMWRTGAAIYVVDDGGVWRVRRYADDLVDVARFEGGREVSREVVSD